MSSRLFFLILIPALALLACSLIFNWLALAKTRHLYEAQLDAQLWPMGLPAIASDVPADGAPVLLFGDSRMVDWGAPMLRAGRTINGSCAGLTTSQLALRLPAWLEACHPRVVVLEAGINDLKMLGMRPDLYETIVPQCVSNMNAMLDQCRQHQARVILLSVWPPGAISPLRSLVWNPAVDRAVTDLNHRLMQAVAGRNDVVWLDLLAQLPTGTAGESLKSLYRDDLHLQKKVYLQLTPLLDQALLKTLSE